MKTNPNRIRPASRHYQSEQAYLVGVPQILDEARDAIRRDGMLTDDLERRNAEAIAAACNEIKRRYFQKSASDCIQTIEEEDEDE